VHAALRLGLYQLLFLERIPAYAAVDASVRLAGRRAPRGGGARERRAPPGSRRGSVWPAPSGPGADPLGRIASSGRILAGSWSAGRATSSATI
jgi:hypothetical protein